MLKRQTVLVAAALALPACQTSDSNMADTPSLIAARIDAGWDFDDPAASAKRFEAMLAETDGPYDLELEVQVQTQNGLQFATNVIAGAEFARSERSATQRTAPRRALHARACAAGRLSWTMRGTSPAGRVDVPRCGREQGRPTER